MNLLYMENPCGFLKQVLASTFFYYHSQSKITQVEVYNGNARFFKMPFFVTCMYHCTLEEFPFLAKA